MTETMQSQRAADFLRQCAKGQSKQAFATMVAPGFVHHNPHFAADAQSLQQAMADNAQAHPTKTFEIQHLLCQGELVAVHSKITLGEPQMVVAVVHLLRFENDLIAELWDIGQAVPVSMVNALGMF